MVKQNTRKICFCLLKSNNLIKGSLDEEVEDKFTVKNMIEGARTDRNMSDD